jgi:hypothetical protein
MAGCYCARVRNAVCESGCTLDTWDRLKLGHGSFVLWPVMVVEVLLHHFLAKGSCWHNPRTRNRHESSCYLIQVLVKLVPIHRVTRDVDIHSGFASSHFFFRLRHVPQPVLVRLANCLFLFLGSVCCTAAKLRSVEFLRSSSFGSLIEACGATIGGILP